MDSEELGRDKGSLSHREWRVDAHVLGNGKWAERGVYTPRLGELDARDPLSKAKDLASIWSSPQKSLRVVEARPLLCGCLLLNCFELRRKPLII